MSVEQSPTRITSAPWLRAPSESASASGADDGRMSSPIARLPAPVRATNARPIRSASFSSSWSG
jgi:hypothetical protein